MTTKDLYCEMALLPSDYEVTFLCPDGFEDFLEEYTIDHENKRVMFTSYIYRGKSEANNVP